MQNIVLWESLFKTVWLLHDLICMRYHLIVPQNIMKIITIWDTVAGISGLLGVWFCGGGGGGGGCKHRT